MPDHLIHPRQRSITASRTAIWIGDIQWSVRNGFYTRPEPILRRLEAIECRDALLNRDGTAAEWPKADYIVGNPPFLGGNVMRRAMGEDADKIRNVYADKVSPKADLVCHWFVKASEKLQAGETRSIGLVATTSIKVGASRKCSLDLLQTEQIEIFNAWSNIEWEIEGASVRVSTVCAGEKDITRTKYLNGVEVDKVPSNLGGAHGASKFDPDLSKALVENCAIGFDGFYPVGPFYITGAQAREWLTLPLNPNGRPNSDVLFPHWNGDCLVGRSDDRWIIDFGALSLKEAALYAAPFAWVKEVVLPVRAKNARKSRREKWWQFGEASPGVRAGLKRVHRYIGTPKVSKHRIFVWLDVTISPNAKICAIMKDDDFTFGVLSSKYHTAWAEAHASRHGVGDDLTYNTTRTFETFPFPTGTPACAVAVETAARRLDHLRRNWLSPANLVKLIPEIAEGYPNRLCAINANAEIVLKKRTLTNLYNEMPTWLVDAQQELDSAVAAAYGWPSDIATEDALSRLLILNGARSSTEADSVVIQMLEGTGVIDLTNEGVVIVDKPESEELLA